MSHIFQGMSKDKCGIYQILCRPTGKKYVGSSRNIYNRWTRHRAALRAKSNGCWKLQKSWIKHGGKAFLFSVLEECGEEELLARERHYIDRLRPELNVVKDLNAGAISLAIAANKIRWALITHCPHGHEYTAENSYIDRNGTRVCRRCNADRVASLIAAESEEERSTRIRRNNERYYANYERDRAKQLEYLVKNREAKREYDRQHRAEHAARSRRNRQKETPEQRERRLRLKRESYFRCKEIA